MSKKRTIAWIATGLSVCLSMSAIADQRGNSADAELTVAAALSIENFKTDTLKPESARAIEEIVVFGIRKPRSKKPEPDILEDPLRVRVLEEIRELRLLDGEFEWRTETADLTVEPPRLRVGYDPRDDARLPETSPQVRLPIDGISVNPATLFSVDF